MDATGPAIGATGPPGVGPTGSLGATGPDELCNILEPHNPHPAIREYRDGTGRPTRSFRCPGVPAPIKYRPPPRRDRRDWVLTSVYMAVSLVVGLLFGGIGYAVYDRSQHESNCADRGARFYYDLDADSCVQRVTRN